MQTCGSGILCLAPQTEDNLSRHISANLVRYCQMSCAQNIVQKTGGKQDCLQPIDTQIDSLIYKPEKKTLKIWTENKPIWLLGSLNSTNVFTGK